MSYQDCSHVQVHLEKDFSPFLSDGEPEQMPLPVSIIVLSSLAKIPRLLDSVDGL